MDMTDPKEPASILHGSWTLDTPDDGPPDEPTNEESPAPGAGLSALGAGLPTPASGRPQLSEPSEAPPTPPPLLRILEAMLFVGGAPLTPERACSAIHGLTPAQFREQIEELSLQYRQQGRPYQIRLQEQGYILALKPRFHSLADRLQGSDRSAKLSQAAIDTLALVAYRQPAAKQEIDAIRGGDSGSLLRQLLRRGLIAVQRGQADQREITYCTTRRFLELFNLKSLDDLPQTQDLQRI
jgi:segregation and condensation protein B